MLRVRLVPYALNRLDKIGGSNSKDYLTCQNATDFQMSRSCDSSCDMIT